MYSDIEMDELKEEELLSFLSSASRPDVRSMAMQYFLGLTGILSFYSPNKRELLFIMTIQSYIYSQLFVFYFSAVCFLLKERKTDAISLQDTTNICMLLSNWLMTKINLLL